LSRTAILFPGQGAQAVGMGRDIVERSAAARALFERAGAVLGFDLMQLCFDGPADRLNATDISQPAIFVTSAAIWTALAELPEAATLQPEAFAGLSLGEYTALWRAGSMEFEDGLRLVRERGRFMQEAAESRRGGMVSVMGLDPAQVTAVCKEAAGSDVLAPANFNSPGQIVISGDQAACERSVAVVERLGGRAMPLKVAGAFHSPLMKAAADRLRPILERTPFRPPEIPVVSNVNADYHRGTDNIRRLLEIQVAEPIQWEGTIRRLLADGFTRFVEVGPGRVLTGLMRGIDRTVETINVSSAPTMDKFLGTAAT